MIVQYNAKEGEAAFLGAEALPAILVDGGADAAVLWVFPCASGQKPQMRRGVPQGEGPGEWTFLPGPSIPVVIEPEAPKRGKKPRKPKDGDKDDGNT